MENKSEFILSDLENSKGFVVGQTHFIFMLLNQLSLPGIVSATACQGTEWILHAQEH